MTAKLPTRKLSEQQKATGRPIINQINLFVSATSQVKTGKGVNTSTGRKCEADAAISVKSARSALVKNDGGTGVTQSITSSARACIHGSGTMRHREPTRGERNANWIERYCLYPSGRDKRQRVRLTPAQREIVHLIYDHPDDPQPDVTGALGAYIALLHLCGPEGKQQGFRPAVSSDIFTVWGAVGPELRRVVELDGGAVVCPALGTRYPVAA
jgi:hypothetical protein